MFKPAQRHKMKVNMMISGGSGAGKTVGALLIAKGIVQELHPGIPETEVWKKIAVIDTEHERALFRANMTVGDEHIGEFLHLNFEAPFDPRRLPDIFKEAGKMGVEVIITDSLSHFWGGEGGLLDIHQSFGGQFQHWQQTNKVQADFLKLLTEGGFHTISTARTKQDMVMEKDEETGKTIIRKLGLKSEIRDGFEYEFAISVQVDHLTHDLIVMKDNSELIAGREDKKASPDLGRDLVKWADQGVDVVAERKEAKLTLVKAISEAYGQDKRVKAYIDKQKMILKFGTVTELNMSQLEKMYKECQKLLKSS
jgi:hypothetical protein